MQCASVQYLNKKCTVFSKLEAKIFSIYCFLQGNEVNQSTTVTDFSPNSGNRRLFPNPEVINKVR